MGRPTLGAESVAESVLRAYQIAMTEPRGPVYLCFDVELQESLLPEGFQLPDLSRFRPPATPWGNEDAISQAAKTLLEAEWPVLLVQELGRTPGGSEALSELVDLLALPVIEVDTAYNLPNSHPMNVTGANAEVLQDADLVISVDVHHVEQLLTRAAPDLSGGPPGGQSGLPRAGSGHTRRFESLLSEGTKLVRIGMDDYGAKAWTASYGRLLPADVSILGNGAQALASLNDKCREGKDAAVERRVSARLPKAQKIHDSIYEQARRDLKERWWDQKPTASARLSAEVWEAIKDEDWVLVHGSLSGWERRLWEVNDPARWVAGGGGTGTGMGVAMGAALAYRGTGKICVSFQQDGDLLYTGGSMWTAAHHNIPMLVVMFNNQSYYQDIGHQNAVSRMRERSLETVGIGVNLQGPVTDFATLAKSFSLYGDGPILESNDIASALKRGIKVVKDEGRLALIDTVTQPR